MIYICFPGPSGLPTCVPLSLLPLRYLNPSWQEVPGSKPREAGARLAASYANCYVCNGGVVMPAFGGEAAQADARCDALKCG